MIICSCNVIRDRDFNKAGMPQAKSCADVKKAYLKASGGKKPNCGTCIKSECERVRKLG